MRVVVGSDERTYLTDKLLAELDRRGHEVGVVGPLAGDEEDAWPDVGREVGEAVAGGRADIGIALCWTGTGVSIAANKIPGVRAALCGDAKTADGARRWNHANVLALSLRLTTPGLIEEILDAWFAGPALHEEKANIDAVRAIEDRYRERAGRH